MYGCTMSSMVLCPFFSANSFQKLQESSEAPINTDKYGVLNEPRRFEYLQYIAHFLITSGTWYKKATFERTLFSGSRKYLPKLLNKLLQQLRHLHSIFPSKCVLQIRTANKC